MRPRASKNGWDGRVVLITGIGGFVGSALAKALLERGAKVVGILRDSGGTRRLDALGIRRGLDLAYGSVTDAGLMMRVIGEYEVNTIFHLAAQTTLNAPNRSPIPTFESNIAGTWSALEAARLSPVVERVVVASSFRVYGDLQAPVPFTESAPMNGRHPYDASKSCADLLAQSYAATYPLPVAVVRSASVYGPGDTNWSRLIPGAVRSALSGEDPVITTSEHADNDYLYLADAIEGYIAAAEHLPEVSGEAINLGTARSASPMEVVQIILSVVGDSGVQARIVDEGVVKGGGQGIANVKARELLDWAPIVSLEDGVTAAVEWYREYLSPGRLLALSSGR
jgi:CDP-glucose 4,6-dehydratase